MQKVRCPSLVMRWSMIQLKVPATWCWTWDATAASADDDGDDDSDDIDCSGFVFGTCCRVLSLQETVLLYLPPACSQGSGFWI